MNMNLYFFQVLEILENNFKFEKVISDLKR